MAENPWDSADMAIVALRVTQHLTGLMVARGLITHDELAEVYASLTRGLNEDASAAGAMAYLDAITPAVFKK